MLKRVFFISAAFLSLTLFQSGSSKVLTKAQQIDQDVRPFTDLTLEISSPQQGIMPLQPIPIVLKQINQTNQKVLGYKSVSFASRILIYAKKRGSDEQILIYPLKTSSMKMRYSNPAVSPGLISVSNEWINLFLDKYFSEPAIYEIHAVLMNANRTQRITSNTIEVEIKAPIGSNRIVYDLIRNSPHKDYLFSNAEFEKTQDLLELVSRHPNSAYAKSAFYSLGANYFVRKQYPRALAHLARLEYNQDFIFAQKVREYLIAIRSINLIQ